MASLTESPNAYKLYDNAIKYAEPSNSNTIYLLVIRLAVNHDWAMEEAWALYLEGCHFLRCGVE
jgi:hypothetical protein